MTTLGDYVWNDLNINGVQDAGELPVQGVTVTLHTVDFGPDGIEGTADDVDTSSGSTTTDANGLYQFTNLVPGNYYVIFTLPTGYVFSEPTRAVTMRWIVMPTGLPGRLLPLTCNQTKWDTSLDAGMFAQIGRIGLSKRGGRNSPGSLHGTWRITYEILIRNYSNVDLTDIRATDDFTATFPDHITFLGGQHHQLGFCC